MIIKTIQIYLLPVLFLSTINYALAQDEFYNEKTIEPIQLTHEVNDSAIFSFDNYYTERDYHKKYHSEKDEVVLQEGSLKDSCCKTTDNSCKHNENCSRNTMDRETVDILINTFVELVLIAVLFWD